MGGKSCNQLKSFKDFLGNRNAIAHPHFIYLLVIYLIRFDKKKKHMMQHKMKIATKNTIQTIVNYETIFSPVYKCFPNIYHGK